MNSENNREMENTSHQPAGTNPENAAPGSVPQNSFQETFPPPLEPVTDKMAPDINPQLPLPGFNQVPRERSIVPVGLPFQIIKPRSRWKRFLHWEYLGLVLILAVTLAFHFVAIERPNSIVWDEVWYVGDARSIVSGNGDQRLEHPPLGKLFIVAGEVLFNGFKAPESDTGALLTTSINSDVTVIKVSDASLFRVGSTIRMQSEQMDVQGIDTNNHQITVKRGAGGTTTVGHTTQQTIYVFQDNAFDWRFFSVIFGTIGIALFYFICRRLKFSWKAAMIATFLFAFEDMTFLHSGLALLDVFMVTFMLLAVWLYLRGNYALMGVAIALSGECKLVGVLIFIAIFLHWYIYRKDKWAEFLAGFLLAIVAYVFFLVFFDYFIVGHIENPVKRLYDMYKLTGINTFTPNASAPNVPRLSISSRPWTWVYPQFLQFYYNSPNEPFIIYSYDPQYISFISTTVQILILPTVGYLVFKATKKRSNVAGFLLLWFLATYVLWIPLDLIPSYSNGVFIGNRVTFVFYFLATTPMICMGIAMALSDAIDKMRERIARTARITIGTELAYAGIGMYLFLHFMIFVLFNPAIPTLIKTWEFPFSIGVDPTTAASVLPVLLFGPVPLTRWFVKNNFKSKIANPRLKTNIYKR